ncbi:hypothetical protein GCM10017566_37970 [Amycolatopsis bartoniae]|uniref:HTH cro/C1-type domain-containing protein n=1 Tax=Amycolatopsis bartoniae TaxID=941986 RepID=A0A8H9J0X1_9PSEU|nr:helix-turn-helix transcriptional regulator [Amycolatopsis bartoniae]GHF60986.1 hypothetical protein GCM10017566_37970 [Amycolatopsis bartoniae]
MRPRPAGDGQAPCTTRESGPPHQDAPPEYPILGYGQLLRWPDYVEKSIYSAEYQQVCELLRQLRHEAGLTQVQVAEALGVPQSFVSKYESGQRRLDVVELRHVVDVLNTTLINFMESLEGRWKMG